MTGSFFSSEGWVSAVQVFCRAVIMVLLAVSVSAQQKVEDITNPEQHYLYAAGLMQRNFHDLALPQLKTFAAISEHGVPRSSALADSLLPCLEQAGGDFGGDCPVSESLAEGSSE